MITPKFALQLFELKNLSLRPRVTLVLGSLSVLATGALILGLGVNDNLRYSSSLVLLLVCLDGRLSLDDLFLLPSIVAGETAGAYKLSGCSSVIVLLLKTSESTYELNYYSNSLICSSIS